MLNHKHKKFVKEVIIKKFRLWIRVRMRMPVLGLAFNAGHVTNKQKTI